jgi:hypothetical protein
LSRAAYEAVEVVEDVIVLLKTTANYNCAKKTKEKANKLEGTKEQEQTCAPMEKGKDTEVQKEPDSSGDTILDEESQEGPSTVAEGGANPPDKRAVPSPAAETKQAAPPSVKRNRRRSASTSSKHLSRHAEKDLRKAEKGHSSAKAHAWRGGSNKKDAPSKRPNDHNVGYSDGHGILELGRKLPLQEVEAGSEAYCRVYGRRQCHSQGVGVGQGGSWSSFWI